MSFRQYYAGNFFWIFLKFFFFFYIFSKKALLKKGEKEKQNYLICSDTFPLSPRLWEVFMKTKKKKKYKKKKNAKNVSKVTIIAWGRGHCADSPPLFVPSNIRHPSFFSSLSLSHSHSLSFFFSPPRIKKTKYCLLSQF